MSGLLPPSVEACQELEAMNSFWESATKSSVGWSPWGRSWIGIINLTINSCESKKKL
jgi:hypothetical protein